jgi:hypothetical protein
MSFRAFKMEKYDTALILCRISQEKNVPEDHYLKLLSAACHIQLNEPEQAVHLLKSWHDSKR